MTEQIDTAGARASAQAFFDEMLDWEIWSLSVWDDEERDDERREQLQAIFETYLSGRALKREQSRYDGLSFQEPPEFGAKITSAEETSNGQVWIYLPVGNIGGRARYLMKYEDGQWKIETRECDIGNSGEWAKEPHI